MSIARSALIVGPARCLLGAVPFFTNENFEAKIDHKTFRVRPEGFSQGDERSEDFEVVVSPTPDGRWNAGLIAALWPYTNAVPGASVFGATDTAFTAHGADTGLLTVKAAAVTKMPGITFSARKTLIESCEIRGLRASGMDPDDADSLLTYAATGGTFVDAAFSLATIKTQPYVATWGAVTGFAAMQTLEGFKFEPEVDFHEISPDGIGLVDRRVVEVRAMVSCIPIGPTASQILAALKVQGTGAAIGASLAGQASQLQITGADGINYLTIPKAMLRTAGMAFGSRVLREGEIGWVANMDPALGVQGALFTLAAS